MLAGQHIPRPVLSDDNRVPGAGGEGLDALRTPVCGEDGPRG